MNWPISHRTFIGRKLAGAGIAVDAATGTVVGKAVSVARTDSESGQEVAGVSLAIFFDNYRRDVFVGFYLITETD